MFNDHEALPLYTLQNILEITQPNVVTEEAFAEVLVKKLKHSNAHMNADLQSFLY